MTIEGRVALVTGAARRVGRAIAIALAERGAYIALHYHASERDAEATAREIRQLGTRVELFQADLGRTEEIERLFSQIDSTFEGLSVLVNSAANFQHKSFLEITPADWSSVIDLNLRAPFFCAQEAARRMISTGGGAIVNISDVAGLEAWPGYSHHCISKAGVIMMTRALARALAPGIRVNAVAPGPVLPPEELNEEERRELAEMTVLKRLGRAEDASDAAIFLIESDYITGETIVVDGGKMLA